MRALVWWCLLGLTAWAGAVDEGVAVAPSYTGEVWASSRGGWAHTGSADVELTFDGARLAGLPGLTAGVYGVANHSNGPHALLGDAQYASNIEAPSGVALYQAWLEQAVGPVSLRAGVLELNNDFDVNEPGLVFLHASQSMGADLGLSGVNGPSSFPATGLAARLRVATERFWLLAAATDGLPQPVRNDFALRAGDGAQLLGEGGLHLGARQLTAGAWGYTTGGYGAYGMVETPLWVVDGDRGLFATARFGGASGAHQRFSAYVGGGVVWAGPWAEREGDVLGISVAAARTGAPARAAGAAAGETAVEATWRVELTPAVGVQPSVQWIGTPDADPGLRSGTLIGLRLLLAPTAAPSP